MSVLTLSQMLEAGVHFGHQTRRWNPKMRPYIFTERNGIHVIDLTLTAQYLEEAYGYLQQASSKGKKVLFVGTKRQAASVISQEASRCGMYWVNQRWLGGMLTNWTTIKTRVDRLKDLEAMSENGMLERLPKKEASSLRRELERLQKYLGGIKRMRRLPDILFVVDQRRENNAVLEARRLGIEVIALLDTNCDPDMVNVGIPANDDAIRSIRLIVGRLTDAIIEGRGGSAQASDDENEMAFAVGDDEVGAEEEEEAEVPESEPVLASESVEEA